MKLENYIQGNWVTGDGDGTPLINAVNGEEVAVATTKGFDFKDILEYGRRVGNPALRKMTFQERGMMLKKLGLHLMKHKARYLIKPEQLRLIPGLILREVLETYSPMHR